jgi:hypothetical protein
VTFSKMNRWQRLWFGATCLGVVFALVYPLVWIREHRSDSLVVDRRRDLEADLQNPGCREYAERPLSEVIEPPFGEECYQLYRSRRSSQAAAVPYTLVVYNADEDARYREIYFSFAGISLALVVVSSALVYFCGVVMTWIGRRLARSGPPL